ncbi:MAG: phenylalanine--tRNA ligase subunit beta [Acidimicrobiaceae bacterium]|nr:phenylalanine--tRNA ligase subunit beta [Acidimicrobiaceae bacterium]
MKVLLSWLREFVPDIGDDHAMLGDVLSGLGLNVEEVSLVGVIPDGVVLGRVVALRPHPNADKMQLVDVEDGSGGDVLQVCCGAFNMAVGDLIPLARVGTVMPNGMQVRRAQLRGQVSNGMCCSEAELGLGSDADGIMILDRKIIGEAELGMSLEQALGVKPDVLWDLEVNPNRPDAMCVMGVARDLAAKFDLAFEPPVWSPEATAESAADVASVKISDPTLCGRFSVRLLRNVTVGESPSWLADRLTALGMRPINNIVDISNYVMLESGQPSHAFDLACIPDGRLQIRRAAAGERLVTLDGAERVLAEGDGVITDSRDRILSIAGVMGGASTEISSSTTDVLLEMAWWDPPSISRTVKRLNLSSEAATRFRRGTDWGENVDRCFNRFAQLAAESGVTLAAGTVEAWGDLPDRTPVRVRPSRINGLLGTELEASDMSKHLRSIGFGVSENEGGTVTGDGNALDYKGSGDLRVAIPTWRWDVTTETDISEEVARLHGYENIGRTVVVSSKAGGLSPYQKDRRLVRDVLAGAGCDEIQPMPFVSVEMFKLLRQHGDAISVTNPVDAEEPFLRTSLLLGHLKAVAYNQRHFNGDVRFFEIGHVYLPPLEGQLLPDEREYLAVTLAGEEAPAAVAVLDLLVEAFDLCAAELSVSSLNCELQQIQAIRSDQSNGDDATVRQRLGGLHPTRCAEVVLNDRVVGVVGEADPAVLEACGVEGRMAWLELDLIQVLDPKRTRSLYRPVSKYPPSDVDLAFVVPDTVNAAQVERALLEAASFLLTDLQLFDVYRGAGIEERSRSLTYRLRFQALDHTLTDAEVAEARQACIDGVARRTGGKLRA